jgi:hypothetical protein
VIWTSATEKADNSDAERVVGRFEMSIDRIMIPGEEDGVPRRRNLRLSGGERWRNGMLMLRRALEPLLAAGRIGKKPRGQERLRILSENDRRTTTGITCDWFVPSTSYISRFC